MAQSEEGGLEKMVRRTFVVTTAQRDAKPHYDFLRSLDTYADFNDAEILILPTNGESTSIKGMEEEELHPYMQTQYKVIEGDLPLNVNIGIRRFPVKAQQMDPTTSWDRFVAYDKSAIMPSPKQRMRVVPTNNDDIPKVLMSTGACTQPHYRSNNWGEKAKLDHVYGAVVVEVDDVSGEFHFRQLRANVNGAFYDLGIRYDGARKPKAERPDALILGDYHTEQIDPVVLERSKALIRQVRPKSLFLHDLFDGFSISHHDKDNITRKAQKVGQLSLEDELYTVGDHLTDLKALQKNMKIYVVKGNHDEVIDRWLREGRFIHEPENIRLGLYLMQAAIDGKDVLEQGINKVYGRVPGVKFLSRDDNVKVRGWQLANHGDLGANGGRPGIRTLESACGKQIVGHSHTPQIYRNVFVVGTSTPLRLDYTRGPSSWMNTHAILHPNGQPQLVNVINGRYTFKNK